MPPTGSSNNAARLLNLASVLLLLAALNAASGHDLGDAGGMTGAVAGSAAELHRLLREGASERIELVTSLAVSEWQALPVVRLNRTITITGASSLRLR